MKINETLKYKKIVFKNDYKFTQKYDYQLWIDLLKLTLTAYGLLDVIDSEVTIQEDYTTEQKNREQHGTN